MAKHQHGITNKNLGRRLEEERQKRILPIEPAKIYNIRTYDSVSGICTGKSYGITGAHLLSSIENYNAAGITQKWTWTEANDL